MFGRLSSLSFLVFKFKFHLNFELITIFSTLPGRDLEWRAEDGTILAADRYYTSTSHEETKTAGCMASSLECNMWLRAATPGKMEHELCGGGGAISKADLLFRDSARDMPAIFKAYPALEYLGPKIAHFLHDYHKDWFQSAGLPPPNGAHDQLAPQAIRYLLARLQPMQTATMTRSQRRRQLGLTRHGDVLVCSHVKIGHRDFLGKQFVRSPVNVVTGSDDNFVFFIPPPAFHDIPAPRRRDFDASLDNCWYGRVLLLFKVHKFCDDLSSSGMITRLPRIMMVL
jgi:hypothetical protein